MLWTKIQVTVYGHFRWTRRSRTIVRRVLQEEALYPFHVQRVQLFQRKNHSWRIAFAQWFIKQIAAEMHFDSYVLQCDQTSFSREGVLSTRNAVLAYEP